MRSGDTMTVNFLTGKELGVRKCSVVVVYDKNGSMAEYVMNPRETSAETDDYLEWSVAVPIYDSGLYWYRFKLITDEDTRIAGRDPAGSRAVLDETENWWQETVYQRCYEVPEWIEGGVFYHIFVDRFNASGERIHMDGKIDRCDWGGMPVWQPDENGRIQNNDFFGGNIRGIIEKLDYLESLGVTCLYLSPVFSAYSNHKYDTSDYMTVDPMFGTEDDLAELFAAAGARGMRVILDGVFAHTGSDSIYFDKAGRYGGGAYQDPDSKYRDWYSIKEDGTYEAWWGIDTLPRIRKESPSYREFICGENGVARKWLRLGSSGWRLDVADELPNLFLEELARAVKTEKPDSILLGEVWEDASNKIAYSERKNYFEGDKLDSVMNYPFRVGIISFVRYGDAYSLAETVERIVENYPPEVTACLMNMLGTHDTERILTALGGKDFGSDPPRDVVAGVKMTPEERERAVRLLKIASVLQMTLPGVPCVYYGDEAGTEGYKDPFNRTCFPWGNEDPDIMNWYRNIIRIRRSHAVYKTGRYRTAACVGGLYAFERYADGERMVTAANCGEKEELLLLAGCWRDLLTGREFRDNITLFPQEVLLLEEIK